MPVVVGVQLGISCTQFCDRFARTVCSCIYFTHFSRASDQWPELRMFLCKRQNFCGAFAV